MSRSRKKLPRTMTGESSPHSNKVLNQKRLALQLYQEKAMVPVMQGFSSSLVRTENNDRNSRKYRYNELVQKLTRKSVCIIHTLQMVLKTSIYLGKKLRNFWIR